VGGHSEGEFCVGPYREGFVEEIVGRLRFGSDNMIDRSRPVLFFGSWPAF
jgi:hypothetical protein